MADTELRVKVTLDIEPTENAEVILRQIVQEEIQAVLSQAGTSETIQASVRRIAREEIEAFKREQNEALRSRIGPRERKGEA